MRTERLGIYYSDIWNDGGRLYSIGPFAKYVEYVARRFKEVVIIAPTTHTGRYDLTYRIHSANVRLMELPFYSTTLEAMQRRKEIIAGLKRALCEYDILWTRYPAPYGDVLCREAQKMGKQVFVQIVGDPLDAVRQTDKYRGLKRLAAMTYARYKESQMMRITKNIPVFTNGSVLYKKFSECGSRDNVHQVISSTLLDDDYSRREDTCGGAKIQLLFIGYFQQRKGLRYLLKAFHTIRQRYPHVELSMVGDGEENGDLEELVSQLGLKDSVTMTGWLPMGEAVNKAYREADIFVYPTIGGEGTPRAILGAMANSLPVVATRTAGIPDVITDGENGILVEPKSDTGLADAVAAMIGDGVKRRQYIQQGFETAQKHSMHHFLDEMLGMALPI